jgi:hypothetical protein
LKLAVQIAMRLLQRTPQFLVQGRAARLFSS